MLHSEGSTLFDDIPSVSDKGYPTWDYISRFTRGLVMPPETSTDKRETIENAIKTEIENKEVQEWVDKSGNPVNFQNHEKFGNAIQNAFKKIPKVINLDKISK